MGRCSIIIPVYNRAALTRQCLETLLAHTEEAECEIIVVDDGSRDTTADMLASYGSRLRVITHTTNQGFATACNEGAAAATGDYLIFLNNDTIPQAGWLTALITYAEANPAAAIIGSQLLFPNDTIQHAGVVICQDHYPRHLYAGFPANHPAVNQSRRFQIITAACMLVRSPVFLELNGFDRLFHNGYEDVDLCLRAGGMGYEIHYCAASRLYHYESVSEGRFDALAHNTQLYLERWGDRVRPDDLDYYLGDGLLTLQYRESLPLQVGISPLLATSNGAAVPPRADELLVQRAQQVATLLREQIQLQARICALEDQGDRAPWESTAHAPSPQLLCTGQTRVLDPQAGGRLVSILLPTKNGAAGLRELLPRLTSQRGIGRIELIAVDSGSTDESIDLLRQFGATVLAIAPETFNHGLTRNLATRYARGHEYIFVNQGTLPADEQWLLRLVSPLRSDPQVAGVCSRVLPRPDADLLTARDGRRDASAAPERQVRSIGNWFHYKALTHHEQRLFVTFHTVSAAIRPQVLQRFPFCEVRMGEDILWAKEVLEAGFKIQHEPTSVVYHSHQYSPLDILRRNVDDGLANQLIVGRQLLGDEVEALIAQLITDDWRFLDQQSHLTAVERDHWRLMAAVRRTAQIIGQWIGVNAGEEANQLSLTEWTKGTPAAQSTKPPAS